MSSNRSPEPVEVDASITVDDLEEGDTVRVFLQQCPHCGEWTAGTLVDEERYLCCGEELDPFAECAGEIEVVGKVVHKAGGGYDLEEMVDRLTREQRRELRRLWEEGQDWIKRAEEMLAQNRENKG